ncbi:single-stranded-DNA-specific exonuclease RecJ [Metabacillus idriensis]|uniref:single-stranded-DNA-specific exonuclease RecJ n=1 Tax=Metabacillus idriensis TaxID=324768 RepID=UPI00174BBD27|nr:single-stranded-DNA-specific exonuclease RecJ [Metabacillus idriensis]
MLKAKTRWDVQEHQSEKADELVNALNITPLVASLLVNRGIEEAEQAEHFLHIEKHGFLDPFLLYGMEKTVKRIRDSIANHEKILIFGDYDADGVSSTAIMLETLNSLGAHADFYIPNRFTEGYGPNEMAFRKAHSEGYSLIITVDTGISAVHEAAIAKELGVDLIITDHHEPGPVLPDAYSIIHPKQPMCTYPFKDLAGVGVAFKLAHALLGHAPEHLLELAAIGTIADLVPLHGENRLIARLGISQLSRTERKGLKALLKVAGSDGKEVNEETIGFAIGPRINAVGRLESADPAVHLLMTEDPEAAARLAKDIDLLNKERQKIVSQISEEAIRQVESLYPIEDNPVLVLAKENWNPGVVGIVASRMVEKYYRPTIILSIDHEKGMAKGSARSIAGFDLFDNLSTCREILPHFGGHPMAAGMTLDINDVDQLRERLISLANDKLTDSDFTPIKSIDASCGVEEITVESIEEMNLLAPFGMGNPKPLFLLDAVQVSSMRKIGSDQTHLKLSVEHAQQQLDCIGFGFGHLHDHIAPLSKVSMIGELSINEWNNFRKPQLMIQDLSVNEWQLFDARGARNLQKAIEKIDGEKNIHIVFQKETLGIFKESGLNLLYIEDGKPAPDLDITNKYVTLIDTPPSISHLDALFKEARPERIYAIFHQQAEHFFATIPTREHFKWYYGFLKQKGTFDLKKHAQALARHKGWSNETIDFMSQVFFDLEFATIENGIISVNHHPPKRDLAESTAYASKLQQLELENTLLYSSYQDLKEWFDERMKKSSTLVNA